MESQKFQWGKKLCDKIFYDIGIDFHDEGLMSIVNSVMTHIEYALDREYTPVVDMKDFQSIYHKDILILLQVFQSSHPLIW